MLFIYKQIARYYNNLASPIMDFKCVRRKKYVGENVQDLPPNFLKAMTILILLKSIFQMFGPEKYSRP